MGLRASLPSSTRSEALAEAWRDYFRRAALEAPRHPAARDYLTEDPKAALGRLIPEDVSVLEVGCGAGDLLAGLPHRTRMGVDMMPEVVAEARRRHPEIRFETAEATALEEVPRFGAIVCDRLCHSVL